ncbi:hypothetical protein PoB_001896800 [Plakobranchus ocellatus]|uniref:Uncharacterized protein n=1 Tax=Plakobranchus ocellatus TaxID=259542 RepID=A0AAV3ZCK3_9GAST|nr:hypothetical protein PoB_001896800 [Plakobranchus ocellatus]
MTDRPCCARGCWGQEMLYYRGQADPYIIKPRVCGQFIMLFKRCKISPGYRARFLFPVLFSQQPQKGQHCSRLHAMQRKDVASLWCGLYSRKFNGSDAVQIK